MKIYPSLISADLLHLADVLNVLDAECDGYHIDIMDHHFVPNLTWGPAFVNAIAQATKKPLQVHLMVAKPAELVEMMQLRHDDTCIVHAENVDDALFKTMAMQWRKRGLRVGIALNPATQVSQARAQVMLADEVLLMSVEPGFSGQKFIDVTAKVTELIRLRNLVGASFSIGMDGGITAAHVARLSELGVESVSAANAIFGSDDIVSNIRLLRFATVH